MSKIIHEFSVQYTTNFVHSTGKKVSSSITAAEFLRDLWPSDMNHIERFYILTLNRANQITGFSLVSMGGCSGTVVDNKVVFQKALLSNAQALIVAHNHPSGQLSPSDADLKLTRKMCEAGKVLEIPILDHIILTTEGYYSFADNGKIC